MFPKAESSDVNSVQPPDIIFSEVTWTVPASYNFFSKKRKTILDKVSGHFRSGELTAVMGPSGAGKSTLLNILAGYRKTGFSGEVLINDTDVISSKERSCYIMQDDSLHPLLTVKEIMMIAVHLKLGVSENNKLKITRVTDILESLGLTECSTSLTGKLSGGQRKRLAIALELVDDPPIMFFDEPTSGLDSSASKQCVSLLKNLARAGRTVICTLHQPSALIVEMVDHLYCLVNGRCCYSGTPSAMTTFLSSIGLECPTYHNPADFILEICGGEYGNNNETLIVNAENGKCSSWRRNSVGSSYSPFPLELPVIRREHFNSWYSIKAYYAANTIADLPIQNGVIFGPFSLMPSVMMSGYFIQMKDSPEWSIPLFKISYFRHCLEGLADVVYGYSRSPLDCVTEDYCHYVAPKKFLKELDMGDTNFMFSSLLIICNYLIIKTITYFVLVHQIQNKR